MCNSSAQGKRKGTACTVPRSFPSRPGRLAVTAGRRAGPASSPRCFATLSPGNARLFAGEFMRCSLLVRRAPTLGRDCALCLRIHRGKSTRRLATDATLASRVGAAIVSSAGAASASTSRSTPSASLVHALPLVIGLVRHYRSPCRDFRLSVDAALGHSLQTVRVRAEPRLSDLLMRKRQAANSGRGRTACHSSKLWISSLHSRV